MSVDALRSVPKAIGAKQTAKAVEKGIARLVYVAQDADVRVTLPIRELCLARGVTVEDVPSMSELGKACGIEVGAATVAIVRPL